MQGVSYRASARDEATRLGLAGWVRNLPNGDVEAEAQGDSAAVQRFITWCHRGPEDAAVQSVSVHEVESFTPVAGFQVRR